MFLNMAHRGASAYAPENTLAAFYKALELKANAIETDVRLTKDGEPVLFHDSEMSKKTAFHGSISDYTYRELLNLDVGIHKGAAYKGEHIPTLRDFFAYFKDKDIVFVLELKQTNMAEKIVSLIEEFHLLESVHISSSKFDALEEMRSCQADIKLTYLVKEVDFFYIEKFKRLNGHTVAPRLNLLNREELAAFAEMGFQVRTFGIKSEEDMRRALTYDIYGMTIDFPDVLYRELQRDEYRQKGWTYTR